MGMTSGERSALWRKRQRENPNLHQKYKEKEKERYLKRKENGQLKSVKEMSTREKRKTRRNWKANQQHKRLRDKMILGHIENTLSPPHSPEPSPNAEQPAILTKQERGRKIIRRNRAKAYREIFKLKVDLDNEKRLKEKYRKRAYRLKQPNKTELDRNISKALESKELRKSLTLHLITVRNIRESYIEAKTKQEKRHIRRVALKKSILKKYKLNTYAKNVFGIKLAPENICISKPKKRPSLLKIMIVNFLERDDNSRIKAGKKSTISRSGDKRQIRLLNDSLKNIHTKFLSEHKSKVSYSLFCQMKPFWLLKATEKDRQTCLCKIHENTQYKINRLYSEKVIKTMCIEELILETVCKKESKECMYKECEGCKGNLVKTQFVDGRQVSWKEWRNVRIEKEKVGESGSIEVKKQSVTVKYNQQGTLETLVQEFAKDLNRISRHIFNITNQYRAIRKLRETLDVKSVIIHIDFSENFSCKYDKEIQSMHFGASQRQISIHTGVAYLKGTTISFSTISDCLKHSPSAIWANLKPVIDHLKAKSPVDAVHFVSDGPTTQYRCRSNFYLFATETFDLGFKYATWNFLEAGHGKGAPDGIGATIKRHADQLVNSKGLDIMCAADLMSGLKDMTSILLFEIKEDAVSHYEKLIANVSIPIVPETMKIHQATVTKRGFISSRPLSCFCGPDCRCYSPVLTSMIKNVSHDNLASSCGRDSNDAIANDFSQSTSYPLQPVTLNDAVIGCYCVVEYEGLPYPGLILDADEDSLEVSAMCRIGPNRFFWPLVEDRLWYNNAKVITLLEKEPELVTKRHRRINECMWKSIIEKMGLDGMGKKT